MQRRVFSVLVMVMTLGIDEPHLAQGARAAVIVHNRARMSRDVMADARRIVDRIYARAGVEIVWSYASPRLTTPFHGPTIRIMIITREDAARIGHGPDAVGFTPADRGGHGTLAYILDHRVRSVAHGYGELPGVVLGAAIAHEMGHMLLQSRHTNTGLMRAEFNQADFRRIRTGDLGFTAVEARHLRAHVMLPIDVRASASRLSD
jgi:hypothetical protein